MSRPTTTRTQRWVLGLSALASFMVILDLLVVTTALSTIQRDLNASLSDLEWTVNAYTLSFAVLLMTAAALGDRWGRRRLFAAGLGLFAAASAACALAPNVPALVAARAVQGAGAAVVMPLALALLNTAFPPERRGWALGVYGSVTGLAATVGPILGGAITQGLAWQWIFWVNVPIGLAAIPLVLTRVPEGYGPPSRLDPLGLVLAGGAALGLVWGLVRSDTGGGGGGWGSPEVIGALVAGGVLTVAFVGWELRAPHPMLPMRLFRSRAFSAGNAAILVINGTVTGALFLTAQYQQVALHQGPLAAGLRLLPWGLTPLLLAPRAGALADRIGERSLIVLGCLLHAAGLGWLALVSGAHAGYLSLVVPMTLAGAGFSVAIPAITRTAVSRVAPGDLGRSSGVYSTLRQLGGAFGVAAVGAVFATAGGYGSAAAFSDGYRPALAAAAAIAVVAALAGAALPGRAHPSTVRPSAMPSMSARSSEVGPPTTT